ncbi:MAG TPA: alpha-amylase family glycosyl hydrolase [Thermomicrobiales bacterium]|nr:alpha-amylase family glycosyl hydrolase [Thermomicrobiales bacterium]
MTQVTSETALTDRTGRLHLELDAATGLPLALSTGSITNPLRVGIRLVTEGQEVDAQPFGMAYADTIDLHDVRRRDAPVVHEHLGQEERYVVPVTVGEWAVEIAYLFRVAAPRLEISLTLSPPGNGTATLRDLYLTTEFAPDAVEDWRLYAPNVAIRSGVRLGEVSGAISCGDAAFRGSGMIALERPDSGATQLIWPLSRTEQTVNELSVVDGASALTTQTKLAGRLRPGERLHWGGIQLDLFEHGWDAVRDEVQDWYEPLGFASPNDTPEWVRGANLYEAQIGTSVFWGGWEYSPYPTMRDLYEDVGRIAGLGFDCIQIMPRQPFPSYNVYDYHDIDLSYGDEADLRRVVEAAHAHGMRVILDILMHGVIDERMITATADRVRNGPYFARLDEGTEIQPSEDFNTYRGYDYLVSWARHIIDFEPHWAGGSPGDHPMADEHPEWFIRDSDGQIIGVYTKAFDTNNVAWQEYFTGVCLMLMERLGVDGFRFDAPTYNEVPNWSPATERRASASQLGAVEHFSRLRREIKRRHPDALLYTEPAGVLFRQTMDLVYNYDEHPLIGAVMRPEHAAEENPLSLRDGQDLADWFHDKDATLPRGSMTAHHIDSHDSFWWPLPGFKWRREQYGLPATRALMATWGLSGGAYMMFVGGEQGIEDDLRRMLTLKHHLPELRVGTSDWSSVSSGDRRVYAVERSHGGHRTVVLVNFANEAVRTTVGIPGSGNDGEMLLRDVWNGDSIRAGDSFGWSTHEQISVGLTFDPYQVRVITIRPAATLLS